MSKIAQFFCGTYMQMNWLDCVEMKWCRCVLVTFNFDLDPKWTSSLAANIQLI